MQMEQVLILDPASCTDPGDASTCSKAELPLGTEIFNYVFYVVMVLKTIATDYSIIQYCIRYYRTHNTINQVEIWLLIATAFKVTALLPDYFVREINYLFLIFVLNSATTFWLSHVLHIRGCIIQESPKWTARGFIILLVVRMVLLLVILGVAPFIDDLFLGDKRQKEFWLNCNVEGQAYPLQFLLVFFLDVVSALVDLLIFIISPKVSSKKKRIRQARIADINATTVQQQYLRTGNQDANSKTEELPKGNLKTLRTVSL